ncbi:MAG: formate dehydrogenase subunit gamma, partial [Pseudomonadota bacterium]
MQMIKILMAITFVVFLGIGGSQIIAVDNAYAQTSDTESVTSGDVPGGTTSGSSSDSELWRQIREGNTGNVVGQDKSGGIMIQSQGQEWREIRNGLLPRYSAISLLGILFLLSIFFAIRGRIKIEHGRSNRTLTRFSMLERASH